jgi:hypothetical protein
MIAQLNVDTERADLVGFGLDILVFDAYGWMVLVNQVHKFQLHKLSQSLFPIQ